MKNKYYFLGLLVLFSGLFLVKNWYLYFGSFLIAGILFYLQFRNLRHTLFLISAVSIPYSVGPSRSQLISLESGYSSSYGIIPFTISTVVLSLLLLFRPQSFTIKKSDIVLIVFFIYSLIGFIFKNTYAVSLYGIAQLTVMLIFYFTARVILAEKKIFSYINWILIFTLFYESAIAILQFVLKHPIGIFAEEYVYSDPFGIVSGENISLFRASGSMSHPNNLGILLVALLPAILFSQEGSTLKKKPFLYLFILALLTFAILVTFSRVALGLTLILFVFVMIRNFKKLTFNYAKYFISGIILSILILSLLWPQISYRLSTVVTVLEPGSSLDARVKAIEEAIPMIVKSPFFGVGINRYIEIAPYFPQTDLFNDISPSKISDIHNLFFQIVTSLGIPALIIFIIFLFSLSREFISKINKNEPAVIVIPASGIILFLLASMFMPAFPKPLMRLFFLYAAMLVTA